MNIALNCGEWFLNGYIISGDYDRGYFVYPEGNYKEQVYSSMSFEDCLTWVYNS